MGKEDLGLVESLTQRDYEEAARLLAKKVGKGFKSLSSRALRSALREASGKNCSLGKTAREGLEKALRFKQVYAYPCLTETNSGPHRLYHEDSPAWFLARVIVDPGNSNDEKLETFLTKEVTKQAKLAARRRRARRPGA